MIQCSYSLLLIQFCWMLVNIWIALLCGMVIQNVLIVFFPHVGSCRIIVQMLAHFIWIVWCWRALLPNQLLNATNISLAVSRTLNWLTIVCWMHAIRYHMLWKFFLSSSASMSSYISFPEWLATMATTAMLLSLYCYVEMEICKPEWETERQFPIARCEHCESVMFVCLFVCLFVSLMRMVSYYIFLCSFHPQVATRCLHLLCTHTNEILLACVCLNMPWCLHVCKYPLQFQFSLIFFFSNLFMSPLRIPVSVLVDSPMWNWFHLFSSFYDCWHKLTTVYDYVDVMPA